MLVGALWLIGFVAALMLWAAWALRERPTASGAVAMPAAVVPAVAVSDEFSAPASS